MNLRRIGVLLLLCLMLSGLSLVRAQEDTPLKVVATYSILGDLVQNVAGDNIELTVLVGPDGDSHVYEPTPQDLIALAEADILFENGFEFELWLDDLYEASGSTAIRVEVSAGVDALPFDDDHHHHEHDHDHEHEDASDVTDLSPWAGEWVSGYVYLDTDAGQSLLDTLAGDIGVEVAAVRGVLDALLISDFTNATITETSITYVTADETITCEYALDAVVDVDFDGTPFQWVNFESTTPDCDAYRYALFTLAHGEGLGRHFHMRYGSTNFDDLMHNPDLGLWYPSLYPVAVTAEDFAASMSGSGSELAVFVGAVLGVEMAHDDDHDHDHDHDEMTRLSEGDWVRLAVNDHESGTVHVIDLASGSVVATFDLAARATFYTSESGRYVYAVQTAGNVVNVIDSGVRQVWHDDHYDTDIGSPAVLDFAATGSRPIHFVTWDEWVSIFNDGDGTVAIFSEDDVHHADAEVIFISTERPHHGVGAAVGEYVLAGIANMDNLDSSLPVGVAVYTLDGELVASFPDCPGLHGEAHVGHHGLAFACSDGILIVEWHDDEFTAIKLDYPAGSGDLRAGTLRSAHGGQYILGNFGPDGLITIDYEAGTTERIQLPVDVWRFAVYDYDPAHAVVLTMDGSLHLIDIASGEIEGSVEVVEAFTRPTRGAARPAFALGGHYAYVSEPLPGDIAIVNLETMEVEEDRIFVGGKPSSLAVFGVMGEDHHAHDHDHDHDHHHHDHDHDHAHGEFDPHTWMSPLNVVIMVENIRDALVEVDPDNAEIYEANAEAYSAELVALDEYIREQVATIPEANRVLITNHNVFAYFARDYGFESLSVMGVATTEAADPGAGQIAALVEGIRERGIPAIFAENISNPRLVEQIASEAGIAFDLLYTDALGQPGTPGDTYLGMMRHNIDVIVAALQ
jgi:ABC-type Zn uptake system ZnuABC Zn-binding protein ZnuA